MRKKLDKGLWLSCGGLSSVLELKDVMRVVISKAPLKAANLQSQKSPFDFNVIQNELKKKVLSVFDLQSHTPLCVVSQALDIDIFINLTPYNLKILDDSKHGAKFHRNIAKLKTKLS